MALRRRILLGLAHATGPVIGGFDSVISLDEGFELRDSD
jgi:hypothetical protein